MIVKAVMYLNLASGLLIAVAAAGFAIRYTIEKAVDFAILVMDKAK
jgi:hypothetical protein